MLIVFLTDNKNGSNTILSDSDADSAQSEF